MNRIQGDTMAKARERLPGRFLIAALVTAILFSAGSAARSQTAFITSATLGATRNDFTGWLGMKFTVGASPITVSALGRMYLNANNGTHTVKLIDALSGATVPNSSVSISMASGIAGQFVYGTLASPVTLSANTSYYLVSLETSGGDRWATEYTTVTTTAVASCAGAILSNSSAWTFRPPANTSFVPLNFKYAPANVSPVAIMTSPADGAVFTAPANIVINASASDSDGSVVQVGFFEGANSIGLANTSPYSIPWNNVGPGTYALTVKATDNSGATTTSSAINITVSASSGTLSTSGAPANDNFANAQVISGIAGVAYTVNGNNVNGAKEPGEPFHAGNTGGRSVWYQWTAPSSNQSLFNTIGSDFDTLLAIYVGNGVSALNLVASNDNIDQSTAQSRLSFTSVAGTTYWIAVDGFNGASGNIVLRWEQAVGPPPPANDGFATAPMISGSVGSLNSSSANATKEPGEPNHVSYPGGASVWYQWIAPTANPTTFDTFGSAFDTLLAVYTTTGNSVANLSPVASNNDLDSVTKQSRVSFTPVAGTAYFIAVDGVNAASGNFVLSWNQSSLGNLPDLIIWASSASNYVITNETFLSTDCAVVEGLVQSGARRLLRFTTETRNVGAVDWWLGNPAGNPSFVYAPCHGHYHFNGFMQYRLLNSSGQLVSPGAKVGFCLTDSLRWDSAANSSPKYHCGNQGIQKGWGDVYTYVTSGQWIDITGLPDGFYTLEMTVNPQGIIPETNTSNNTVQIPITIGAPSPSNDNCANALVLNGAPATFTQSNLYGTKETGEANHAGNAGGHSLWFKWTAPNSQTVIIDTIGSTINTLLAVYTGTSVSSLSLVANNDDIGGVFNKVSSRVIFNPVAGTTYLIAVDGYNGLCGNFTINLDQPGPPLNDNFLNAQTIFGGAGSVNANNLLATKEPGELNIAGNPGGHSLWYQWTAAATGTVTIDTVNSDFDTILAVYADISSSGLTFIGSNDDMGGSSAGRVWSQVTFTANSGTTYKIVVDGYSGKRGNVRLNGTQSGGGQLLSLRHPQPVSRNGKLAAPPRQPVLTCGALRTGGFQITLIGQANQSYAIDYSTDLINWTFLHSLQADQEGTGIFIDRSKPAGRVNLLDPWCGAPNSKVYVSPQNQGQGVFYRAVLASSSNQPLPMDDQTSTQ